MMGRLLRCGKPRVMPRHLIGQQNNLLPLPTRCPVCGEASITAVKHSKTSVRPSTGFRCSKGHVFQVIPRAAVTRSKQLRIQARAARSAAAKEIERARRLRK